jgi:hypothetical protein
LLVKHPTDIMEYPDRQGTRAVAQEHEHKNEDATSGKRRKHPGANCGNGISSKGGKRPKLIQSTPLQYVLVEFKMFDPYVKRIMKKMEAMKMRKRNITHSGKETMTVGSN